MFFTSTLLFINSFRQAKLILLRLLFYSLQKNVVSKKIFKGKPWKREEIFKIARK